MARTVKRFFATFILLTAACFAADLPVFRPPAVPLIVHDPYFSIWSNTDLVTGGPTRHWTGTPQELRSMVRIDGKPFRILGIDPRREDPTPTLQQTALQLFPTRTIYEFSGAGIALTLTFLTPAFPDDLEVLSRPATYVIWQAHAADGRRHSVSIYFDAATNLVVDQPSQPVTWGRLMLDGNPVLRAGSHEQLILAKKGDNLRIDWGYLYLAAEPGAKAAAALSDRQSAWNSFRQTEKLPERDSFDPIHGGVLALRFDLGEIAATPVSHYVVVAYDDIFSIEYLYRRLRPYWRRNGATAEDLLHAAFHDYPALADRARKFDDELTADLRSAGGEEYARIATLAYRQTLAAHKIAADIDGTPLMFPKENFSNGCISTVDVIYPSSPFFLLFNPRLLRAQLQPVFEYAALERWRFPFAPHDLGTYPQANGQVYGGGERTEENQMPVEESGNLLILTAALARVEGGANFAAKYWPLLSRWAEYLKQKGLDPENQLSTDDFAGHLAHNANLSIKAILALASYSYLCDRTGRASEAAAYQKIARDFAARWQQMAAEQDHYRLAFDKSGTWSQKYNLVWDRLLGFPMFAPDIARKEYEFYKNHQNAYGLPLDNRRTYTKLDWILWTATLADSKEDFEALARPVYRFLQETPDRVPMSDWYDTITAKKSGFQARSVVGGVFIRMLAEDAMGRKWSTRGSGK